MWKQITENVEQGQSLARQAQPVTSCFDRYSSALFNTAGKINDFPV